jgi:hypothetical protein
MNRKRIKHLFFLILFTLLFITFWPLLQQQQQQSSLIKLKFHHIVYKVNEYFEQLTFLKDDSIIEFNSLSYQNECSWPFVDYKDKQSIYYLQKDLKELNETFEYCEKSDHDSSHSFISINDKDDHSFYLKLNITFIEDKLKVLRHNLKCFIQRFEGKRNESEQNNGITMINDEKYIFNNYELVISRAGFYYAWCLDSKILFGNSKVYDYVYHILPRLKEMKPQLSSPNVLLIGIDSLSFNHFRRIFPITFDYLNDQLDDNLIFSRFNSVGSNTYPNVLAMLTGIIDEINLDFNIKNSEIDYYRQIDGTFHDHLPFIWKEYQKLNYITMFQEDEPSLAIFNYLKDGFRFNFLRFLLLLLLISI